MYEKRNSANANYVVVFPKSKRTKLAKLDNSHMNSVDTFIQNAIMVNEVINTTS